MLDKPRTVYKKVQLSRGGTIHLQPLRSLMAYRVGEPFSFLSGLHILCDTLAFLCTWVEKVHIQAFNSKHVKLLANQIPKAEYSVVRESL